MRSAPHLILVGPMGAGKSTLGRRLSQAKAMPFVDLDRTIEIDAGRTIPELFASEGEAAFRERERTVLARTLDGPGCVLATGGGAVLAAENRARMRRHGFVVYLQIDVERQLARLEQDRSRPLIATGDREAILRRLAAERGPLYAEVADLSFAASDDDLETTAARLIERLDALWHPSDAPSPLPNPI